MLTSILRSIRGQIGGGASKFERYFTNLQYRNGAVAPTREQARRDYLDLYRNAP